MYLVDVGRESITITHVYNDGGRIYPRLMHEIVAGILLFLSPDGILKALHDGR